MQSRSQPSHATLTSLLGEIRAEPGAVNALVAAPDGLLIAGLAGDEEANEMWAAVAAVMGNLGGNVVSSSEDAGLESAVFSAEQYQFVVKPVSIGFVLAVARPNVEMEGICSRVERAAGKLEIFAGSLMGKRRPGGNADV